MKKIGFIVIESTIENNSIKKMNNILSCIRRIERIGVSKREFDSFMKVFYEYLHNSYSNIPDESLFENTEEYINNFIRDDYIWDINSEYTHWIELLKNITIENINKVFLWLGMEFLIVILSYCINRVSKYFYDIQVKKLNIYISEELLNKSIELDISYFENNEFYNQIEKANNQSISSIMGIMSSLIQIIKNSSSLIGALYIVFMLNPLIIILCLATTVPMFFVNIKVSKKKFTIYNNRIEETRFAPHLQRMMLDYNSIKEIKINRLGEYLKSIILKIYNKHLNQDKKIGKKQARQLIILDIINTIISYIYKIYIVVYTINNGLTIGSMTMFMSALSNVDSALKVTLDSISQLYEENLYIENLFDVLVLKPNIQTNANNRIFSDEIKNSIELKNVSFKYPNSEKYVLKNINLKLKANETYAIVGLNGCGKTTLVKLISRLYDPTEGEIFIDGINIKEYTQDSLYKSINIVFQDFIKYPFTVKENISFGDIDNITKMESIINSAKKTGANEFIEKLPQKYDSKLGKVWTGGVDLSLGQWQKLAISRAFMKKSSIMILDEPTASLDAEAEYEIFKDFKKLIKNTTSIMISHRFSTVKMADKIIVMENGKIIELGNHKELIELGGLYSKLYTMQAESYDQINIEKDNRLGKIEMDDCTVSFG